MTAPVPPALRLVVSSSRRGKTPAAYHTPDDRILVHFDDIVHQRWIAHFLDNVAPEHERAKRDRRQVDENAYEIATGHSLIALKKRLALYLADEAAGTLGDRHRYGFSLDKRPVCVALSPAAPAP